MSDGKGKKRSRHEHDEHEEHVNHEAWVIPYADILTLLMALFLVLFALGRTDQEKLELAAMSFRKELGQGSGDSMFDLGIGSGGAGALSSGGLSVFDGTEPEAPATTIERAIAPEPIVLGSGAGPSSVPPATFEAIEDGDAVQGDPLTEIEQTVRSRAAGTGLSHAIGFRREVRGLVVTIVTDQVLFETGQADVRPEGIQILDVIAGALIDLPNAVSIEGHTDIRPISTSRYPSNWELSTARATSVLRYMVEQRGFPSDRLSAAGYADTHPVAAGEDPAALAANRRVEIVVLASTTAS